MASRWSQLIFGRTRASGERPRPTTGFPFIHSSIDFLVSFIYYDWTVGFGLAPARGRQSEKPSENKSLAAFRKFENTSVSRKPTFSSKRRVSITRICERLARASCPSTRPTRTRNGCLCAEVVSGITRQASGPNPRRITHGRTYHSPFPSCSVPIFIPRRHHHISRTVYRCGRIISCVCFFTSFHRSKSFFIRFVGLYHEFPLHKYHEF